MKDKIYVLIVCILFVLGGIGSGIVMLMTIIGSILSGKPFHIIYGANGPIPGTVPVFQTEFFAAFLLGILMIAAGIILLKMKKRLLKEEEKKEQKA